MSVKQQSLMWKRGAWRGGVGVSLWFPHQCSLTRQPNRRRVCASSTSNNFGWASRQTAKTSVSFHLPADKSPDELFRALVAARGFCGAFKVTFEHLAHKAPRKKRREPKSNLFFQESSSSKKEKKKGPPLPFFAPWLGSDTSEGNKAHCPSGFRSLNSFIPQLHLTFCRLPSSPSKQRTWFSRPLCRVWYSHSPTHRPLGREFALWSAQDGPWQAWHSLSWPITFQAVQRRPFKDSGPGDV